MIRAPVNPALLTWSRERARLDQEDLRGTFPKLSEWESGARQPTFKQADDFASRVHVPVGYLFLSEPPVESIPIPDYRTIAGTHVANPSPDLLDVIRNCQDRQSWYRNFARMERQEALSFVASVSRADSPERVATQMRDVLSFGVDARRSFSTWEEGLRTLRNAADRIGVLVMVSASVASNSHRRLNPKEFRGFTLSDQLAPLVYVNGADSLAAQLSTFAQGLAHLWLGSTALSDCGVERSTGHGDDEIWCNAVAMEFLVPLAMLNDELRINEFLPHAIHRLTRTFKVSRLVVLRRLFDIGAINRSRFDKAWREEITHVRSVRRTSGKGSDIYDNAKSRFGRRFVKALVVSTLEGQTLYRDTYRMLGIRRGSSFEELARQINATA